MEWVLVIGAGTMGAGIAQVCAQSGYRVSLMDVNTQALGKAVDSIARSVKKLSGRSILKENPSDVLNRIEGVSDLSTACEAGWVIESVLEIESLKKEIFQELDRLAPADTPLATNTSSIPVTRIAESLVHPERVLGLHFFPPVPLMRLVEVVKGRQTAPEVFQRGVEFVSSLGKNPVRVHNDVPGFVMNRIFCAAFREAVDLVARGIASPGDVDLGMKLGYGWNAGPFEIADIVGLDTVLLVGRSLQALGETGLSIDSDLIDRMVDQGKLGRKSGEGFYRYTPDGRRLSVPTE